MEHAARTSRAAIISAAALRLRVLARKNGYFTDDNAWDAIAEVTHSAITRRLVNAVKAEARRELAANGEQIEERK